MIRLKYIPDGLVHINDTYRASFLEFTKDCEALNIECPLSEGVHLLYTPPRKPKDRDRGVEYINSEGQHTQGDDILHPKMQKIIDNVNVFLDLQKSKQV